MKDKTHYSTQFTSGERSYFFDVKESQEGKRYLVIRDKDVEGKGNNIIVFEEDIADFGSFITKTFLNFHKEEKAPQSLMHKTIAAHPNAYQPWTKDDDLMLEQLFCQKKSTLEMAAYFKRNKGAIRSRIKKLELRDKYPDV